MERLPNVKVLNPVDDIDEIFSRTRVLLVPSLWLEAFPLVPVEAMLRGIPVLASNVGGLPDSKLGVDYVLPVEPITQYAGDLDDRLLPVPIVPRQEIGPWLTPLQRLLADRTHYEELSAASREAALAFHATLSVTPFEQYLESLVPPPLSLRPPIARTLSRRKRHPR